MESLYVCLFSNGHIKVGRSIDPKSRIADHAERVSCMGVELVNTYISDKVDEAERREADLIALCAGDPGATRFKSEWFSGLSFSVVSSWADSAAYKELAPEIPKDDFATRLRRARESNGLSQRVVGEFLGVGNGAISAWEVGRNSPSMEQLRLICQFLEVSADELLGLWGK